MDDFVYVIFSPTGKAVIVGHADGAIIKYNFEDEGLGDNNVSRMLIYIYIWPIPLLCISYASFMLVRWCECLYQLVVQWWKYYHYMKKF